MKKRGEKSFIIIIAVVVGVMASLLTIAITGNFSAFSKLKPVSTTPTYTSNTYTKTEIDMKLKDLGPKNCIAHSFTSSAFKNGNNLCRGQTKNSCLIGEITLSAIDTSAKDLLAMESRFVSCDYNFKDFNEDKEIENKVSDEFGRNASILKNFQVICCDGVGSAGEVTPKTLVEPKTPVEPYAPEPAYLKEEVKCVFSDSTATQECYSDKGDCKGIGTCIIGVSGTKGEKVTWKSSCGGYAYTVIDGQNDYAKFKCMETQKSTATIESPVATSLATPSSP